MSLKQIAHVISPGSLIFSGEGGFTHSQSCSFYEKEIRKGLCFYGEKKEKKKKKKKKKKKTNKKKLPHLLALFKLQPSKRVEQFVIHPFFTYSLLFKGKKHKWKAASASAFKFRSTDTVPSKTSRPRGQRFPMSDSTAQKKM
jgi:hypothetical protein